MSCKKCSDEVPLIQGRMKKDFIVVVSEHLGQHLIYLRLVGTILGV